jgi:hypothetical protein
MKRMPRHVAVENLKHPSASIPRHPRQSRQSSGQIMRSGGSTTRASISRSRHAVANAVSIISLSSRRAAKNCKRTGKDVRFGSD